MDNFLGQRASSPANDDNNNQLPGWLLSNSMISELDLSSNAAANKESIDEHGFVRSRLAPLPTNQGRARDPSRPHNQSILNEYGKGTVSRHQTPFGQPDSYGTPSIVNREDHHRASRDPAPSHRPQGRALASDIYASVSLPPDRFEDDAVPIDARRLPLHPDESQQDLAERINALTQAIQSNTQFCLELSGQMLTLANQNKHLLPAFSLSVSSAVASYVIKPAMRLPGALKTYYPALQDYEDKLRRKIANCANAREMALAQGVGGSESDVKRLKDRLVEQDALLQDSSSYMQRLIRERDALRLKLSGPTLTNTDAPEIDDDGSESSGQRFYDSHYRLDRTNSREDRQDSAVLADKLRELRILVDQLALDTAASNHDRNDNGHKEKDTRDGADGEADEEEGDWTLL
ncbi:hypothetical protein PG984_012552 [Apiospora sp. TS-2023a]